MDEPGEIGENTRMIWIRLKQPYTPMFMFLHLGSYVTETKKYKYNTLLKNNHVSRKQCKHMLYALPDLLIMWLWFPSDHEPTSGRMKYSKTSKRII